MLDAIIVGSGATGAWAAKTLSESGLNVLVLDGGPQRRARAVADHADRAARQARQPIQSQHYAWPADPEAFVDDVDCPYTTSTSFQWIRSRQVGGRMVIPGHGHRFPRMTDREFFAARADGFGEDWPIGLQELTPHFDRVEHAIGFGDHRDNRATHWLREMFSDEGKDWKLRTDGVGTPPQSLMSALATGRAVVQADTIVSRVLVDGRPGRAIGVGCIDRVSTATSELLAKRVILCASAIESARILMNSGIANSSGMLGTHLMDHVATSIVARFPVSRLRGLLLRRGARAYLGPFSDRSGGFLRSYGIQVSAGPATGGAMPVWFDAFGEMLPRMENRVSIHPSQTDKWGIPTVDITCAHSENELRMADHQLRTMRELAAGADGIVVARVNRDGRPRPPGRVNHECGTARMGRSSVSSVLKPSNETWDVENLFVLDGACFVSQGHQNPTLTMLAIADRACRLMVSA